MAPFKDGNKVSLILSKGSCSYFIAIGFIGAGEGVEIRHSAGSPDSTVPIPITILMNRKRTIGNDLACVVFQSCQAGIEIMFTLAAA